MVCSFCGSRILDDMTICENCGAPVSSAVKEEKEKEKEKGNTINITTSTVNYYGNNPNQAQQQTNTQYRTVNNRKVYTQAVPVKKPKNWLGISALIMSMTGPMAFIGLGLAIWDLRKKDGKNKVLSKIAIGFFVISMIGVFSGAFDESIGEAQTQMEVGLAEMEAGEDMEPIVLDADVLLEAIEADDDAALISYLGRHVELTGRKNTYNDTKQYVQLTSISDEWIFDKIDCYLQDDQVEVIDNIPAWEEVTLRGIITEVNSIYGYEMDVKEVIIN